MKNNLTIGYDTKKNLTTLNEQIKLLKLDHWNPLSPQVDNPDDSIYISYMVTDGILNISISYWKAGDDLNKNKTITLKRPVRTLEEMDKIITSLQVFLEYYEL
jgi:hypothetical protein